MTDRPTPAEAFSAARRAMSGPLVRGSHDCVSQACAAFQALSGVDPLGALRGSYRTTGGAARLLRAAGGADGLARRAFAGLVLTCEPASGDLAVVPKDGGFGAAVGLCIVPGWFAVKTARGLAVIPAEVGQGWTAWA